MAWWRKGDAMHDAPEPVSAVLDEPAAVLDVDPDAMVPCGVDMDRIKESLRRLEIRFLTDEDGDVLALWEDHSLLFSLEGPQSTVLVVRARADETVPVEWESRALASVNEWNRSRRFLRCFLGEPESGGTMPVYADQHMHLGPGIHDALLDDLLDCLAVVSCSWVEWLHDDGALL
ncbi:MAG TPA: YbjN domain-containing protein [Mycobacteriales bacterium]|nr:YbjN domain-containing protein [Mycobacteriales bacterium]